MTNFYPRCNAPPAPCVWSGKQFLSGCLPRMKMHVLILADTCLSEHGLPHCRTYAEQFVRQLEQSGHEVMVSYHLPLTMQRAARLLDRLPLHQYDLILLQLGNIELQYPSKNPEVRLHQTLLGTSFGQLRQRVGWLTGKLRFLRSCLPGLAHPDHRSGSLGHLARDLEHTLFPTQVYGHRTILLTPFPHAGGETRRLRRQGVQLFLEVGRRVGVSVFNTHAVVQEREEYFADPNGKHFNATAHELLGRALYEFYRGVPAPINN